MQVWVFNGTREREKKRFKAQPREENKKRFIWIFYFFFDFSFIFVHGFYPKHQAQHTKIKAKHDKQTNKKKSCPNIKFWFSFQSVSFFLPTLDMKWSEWCFTFRSFHFTFSFTANLMIMCIRLLLPHLFFFCFLFCLMFSFRFLLFEWKIRSFESYAYMK